MQNFFPDVEETVAPEESVKNGISAWDEARRMADEIELKIHLAGMDARDRWHALEPRLNDLEHRLKSAGKRVTDAVIKEIEALRGLLDGLRHDVDHN